MAHPNWPLFDLRLHTDHLELRSEWDDGIAELIGVGLEGIHDPEFMPFAEPWTDLPRGGPFERGFYQFHWRQRAEWEPERWRLSFVVLAGGRVVGSQGIEATHFATLGVVSTGSWLGRQFQGQGIGKEMRAAVLHLAFEGLGAREARSAAFHDNEASLAVSRALGYQDNGEDVHLRRQRAGRMINLRLTRERWEQHRWRGRVNIEGLGPCLELFGLSAP